MTETVVCVGAAVRKANKVLLVRQARGHSLEGQWSIPWGQLGRGESPVQAAAREALEESGVTVQVDGLLGVQELPAPWEGMIALIYLCRHIKGDPAPDNFETDAAQYFDLQSIEALTRSLEPFSGWIATRVLEGNYTLIEHNSSNPFSPATSFF